MSNRIEVALSFENDLDEVGCFSVWSFERFCSSRLLSSSLMLL